MTKTVTSYRRYAAAKRAAAGRPIVRVAGIYLVADFADIDQIEVIQYDGHISGHVTLSHLQRLGNANHAIKG